MGDSTDGELVVSIRAGDQQAFETIYHRYRLQLFAYLNQMVGGRKSLVDDLYQQVWIKMLRGLPTYREKQRFISWLFRIAHNITVDHFRHEQLVQEVELDDQFEADSSPPWQALDESTVGRALSEAIERLPVNQREVVLLRRQGVPFKEIALIQGVSINTVLGRMHYSVKRLRKLMIDVL